MNGSTLPASHNQMRLCSETSRASIPVSASRVSSISILLYLREQRSVGLKGWPSSSGPNFSISSTIRSLDLRSPPSRQEALEARFEIEQFHMRRYQRRITYSLVSVTANLVAGNCCKETSLRRSPSSSFSTYA